jgi:hypothetical protein
MQVNDFYSNFKHLCVSVMINKFLMTKGQDFNTINQTKPNQMICMQTSLAIFYRELIVFFLNSTHIILSNHIAALQSQFKLFVRLVWFMVFNATFNNISVVVSFIGGGNWST